MKKSILLFFVFINVAFAQVLPPLRSPQEILDLAKLGRFQYMDAIYEIRNSDMESRPVAVNLEYISILPELKEIESALQYPDFGVKPSKDLADYLIKILVNFAHVEEISNTLIPVIVDWAESDLLYTLFDKQQRALSRKRTFDEWVAFYHKTALFTGMLKKKLFSSLILIQQSEILQGQILSSLLNNHYDNIDITIFNRMLPNVVSMVALENIMHFLDIEFKKTKSPEAVSKLFSVAVLIAEQMRVLHDDSYLDQLDVIGDMLALFLMTSVREDAQLNVQYVELASTYFTKKTWQDLAAFVSIINMNQVDSHNASTLSIIFKKIKSLNPSWFSSYELIQIESLQAQMSVALIDRKKMPEGLYKISDAKTVQYLWLFYSSEWNLNAQLLSHYGDSISLYARAEYNAVTAKLKLASTRSEEINLSGTKYVLFDLSKSLVDQIVIVNGAKRETRNLTLVKTVPFVKSSNINYAQGIFEGEIAGKSARISFQSKNTESFFLIMSLGGFRLSFNNISSCYFFNHECDFWLSTNIENKWAFLRGAINKDNDFEGVLIRGLDLIPFKLKAANN
jgi:hypothetical protein